MLSYKLCKQLKEAGFPPNTKEAFILAPNGKEEHRDKLGLKFPEGYRNLLKAGYDVVSVPTLSELIEAVMEIILENNSWETQSKGNLIFFQLAPNIATSGEIDKIGEIEEWRATIDRGEDLDNVRSGENFFAKTPEEAVAKLYLKLKERWLPLQEKE